MKREQTCETCGHCDPGSRVSVPPRNAECRINPPAPVTVPVQGGPGVACIGVWPQVPREAWCSYWKPQEQAVN